MDSRDLETLDDYLSDNSFIAGYNASLCDIKLRDLISKEIVIPYKNLSRWYNHLETHTRESLVDLQFDFDTVLGSILGKGVSPRSILKLFVVSLHSLYYSFSIMACIYALSFISW